MEKKDFAFRNLDVYKEAKSLVIDIYTILKLFPREEQYALCDQLRRSSVSVPSNIAEGMARSSVKEQIHFMEISYGSLMEALCQVEISLELNYINQEQFTAIEGKIAHVARMLSGFSAYLKRKE